MGKSGTVTLLQVIIDLELTTKVSKEIYPWELPVYEEKFGEGACIASGERACKMALPDAGAEFSRLSACLGADEDTKISFVELAYGRGKHGIKSLEKAISGSTKPKRKAKAKADPKPDDDPEPKADSKPKAKEAEKTTKPVSGKEVEESRDPLG